MSNAMRCIICSDPSLRSRFETLRMSGYGRRRIASELNVSQFTVRNHIAKHGGKVHEDHNTAPSGWNGGVEVTGNSGTICSGPVEAPVSDWSEILTMWGLDPQRFEVVEPVTMKAWDGFAKDNDGEIVSKRLFSYKAQVRTKTENAVSVDTSKWREVLMSGVTSVSTTTDHVLVKNTYIILVADPQIGKPGTQDALENWRNGLTRHIARIELNRDRLERIVVAFMGDEFENVAGNYTNQPYTVELDLSNQIQTTFDMMVWTIAEVRKVGLPITITSVVSNHGELSRRVGKDSVTDIYDNGSTMISRLVQRLYEAVGADEITWNIADHNPDIVEEFSGVGVLFTHGHIAKGRGSSPGYRMRDAYQKQLLGRTRELLDVKLFFGAHWHHAYIIEEHERTFFGCPALEAEKSSAWYFESSGIWSRPGMLGLMVGESFGPRGWGEYAIL